VGEYLDGFHHWSTEGAWQDCIYVVVDRLTKFAHFFVISSKYKAPQVAELFFREVFRLHGLPKYIVSDWDNRFSVHFGRSCSD
jgi:hypothetical protein